MLLHTQDNALRMLDLRGRPVTDLSPLVGMKKVTIYLNKSQQVTVPKELEGQVVRGDTIFG